ncbi:MAG: amidohydrolase family protein [Gammaproteobacteria bacterium]
MKIVSDDSHFEGSPDMWRSYVAREFQDCVPKVVTLDNGGHGWAMPGTDKPVPMGTNLSFKNGGRNTRRSGVRYDEAGLAGVGDGAQRLREMDQDGIDAEIIYPPVGGLRSLYGKLPREGLVAVARGYNDWLSREYTAANPGRLLGVAMIPPSGAQDAADELQRVKNMPGIAGAVLQQWPDGQKVPSPNDDVFWAAAERTGMPLTFHITFGGGPETEVAPENELNWVPFNTMITRGGANSGYVCTRLITSGVFDRFPKLRFSVAEAGSSWLLFYREQLDSNYERHRGWANVELPHLPSWYLNRHFLFGMQDDLPAIRVRHEIGVDLISWGSDFPHSASNWPRSHDLLARMFDGVPDDEAQKILGGNLAQHLGIDLAAVPQANQH